jgi:hypothetical protein
MVDEKLLEINASSKTRMVDANMKSAASKGPSKGFEVSINDAATRSH